MRLVRYADRPDLRASRSELNAAFPEYMHHNAMGGRYWSRLYDEWPDCQLCLVDGERPVAEVHAIPTYWDGTVAGLPAGWDEAFEAGALRKREPNALCALAIAVLPERRGEGLARRMIATFAESARLLGLGSVIAPVRPTLKERYPLIPIERYARWRRDDGSHFDPWIRIHEAVGGEILRPAPRSMVMEAPVAEWEAWTGMRFPDDGEYVFPGALAPLHVSGGVGVHVEPNVWMRHPV